MAYDGYDITFSYDDDLSETDSAIYSDSAESDEMDCPDKPPMSCRCNMDEDINLDMWRHSFSMKQAVNIIIALKRMKHIKPTSSEFGEEEVLNIIMDGVIQERVMERVEMIPSYKSTHRTLQCSICDQFKKTVVKSSGSPRLLAVTLRDGANQYKVDFSLSLYSSTSSTTNSSQPVCLGLSQTNLYLACTKSDNSSPQLVLKEITESLDTIQVGDQYDNLLFFRKETGMANNTFESVKYPGWFISTDYNESKPVEMSQIVSNNRYTNFTLKSNN